MICAPLASPVSAVGKTVLTRNSEMALTGIARRT